MADQTIATVLQACCYFACGTMVPLIRIFYPGLPEDDTVGRSIHFELLFAILNTFALIFPAPRDPKTHNLLIGVGFSIVGVTAIAAFTTNFVLNQWWFSLSTFCLYCFVRLILVLEDKADKTD